MVAKLDVADEHGVTRLLRRMRRSLPPLRGVLHAAMVLDDALLRELDVERFRKVMRPKVQGAWNLHVHTLEAPLDFFVLFSSASAVLASPMVAGYAGANAFLDALAHYRRGRGLPASMVAHGEHPLELPVERLSKGGLELSADQARPPGIHQLDCARHLVVTVSVQVTAMAACRTPAP